MKTEYELLKKTLERNKKKYIETLIGFLACDTQVIGHGIAGGNEVNGQEYIAKILENLGAQVEKNHMNEAQIQKAIQLYYEGDGGHNYQNRYNLVATLKGELSGKSLMFNGHIDTMPFGDLAKWRIDPRRPEIIDGRLYGRGACDMKGGLMGAIMALALLADAGLRPGPDVKILSVIDEEGGGNGTIEAMMDGYRADAAIVCEPSSNHIQITHRGFVCAEIKIVGMQAHSAELHHGVSAIDKGIMLVEAMRDLERAWMLNYQNPLSPPPTINVGVFHGGRESTAVANECTIKVSIHFPPKVMSTQMAEQQLRDTIARRAMGDDWLKDHMPEVTVYQRGAGFQIEPDDDFVRQVSGIITDAMGTAPVIEGSTYAADNRAIQIIGGMPVVTIGPGSITQAHQPDEYVKVEEYLQHILICATIMLSWGR